MAKTISTLMQQILRWTTAKRLPNSGAQNSQEMNINDVELEDFLEQNFGSTLVLKGPSSF